MILKVAIDDIIFPIENIKNMAIHHPARDEIAVFEHDTLFGLSNYSVIIKLNTGQLTGQLYSPDKNEYIKFEQNGYIEFVGKDFIVWHQSKSTCIAVDRTNNFEKYTSKISDGNTLGTNALGYVTKISGPIPVYNFCLVDLIRFKIILTLRSVIGIRNMGKYIFGIKEGSADVYQQPDGEFVMTIPNRNVVETSNPDIFKAGNLYYDFITKQSSDKILIKSTPAYKIEQNGYDGKIIMTRYKRNEDTCVVCMNDINQKIALVPCGHTNLCKECTQSLKECPTCRQVISSVIRLF